MLFLEEDVKTRKSLCCRGNVLELFKSLTRFERGLWGTSVLVIVLSFLISGGGDYLTIIASLIGVTALIFVAKGYVAGQVLVVVFSLFYGVISFFFQYYGEMITYLGMTMPIAIMTAIQWARHPFEGTREVEVSRLTRRQTVFMWASAVIVTVGFYFILNALGNASLFFSTISVTTSYAASFMTLFRSPYYAVGYAANDVVLVILWVIASMENMSYVPMVLCFVMFLLNDLYGFYNWQQMQKRQAESAVSS